MFFKESLVTQVFPGTRRRHWAITLLAVTAAGLSAYLAWMSAHDSALPGCGGSSSLDCDHVLATRWSQWMAVPVSYPAIVTYLAIAGFSWASRWPSSTTGAWAASLLILTSLLAAGASLWFLFLQLAVIGKFCLYCSACHLCGVTIAVLAVWPAEDRPVTRVRFAHLVALAAGGIAILVVGQLVFLPKTYAIDDTAELVRQQGTRPLAPLTLGHPPGTIASQPAAETVPGNSTDDDSMPSLDDLSLAGQGSPRPRREQSASVPPAPGASDRRPVSASQHTLSLADGGITIDLEAHPLLGSPEADHIAVKLFDYSCVQCRKMSEDFERARERYGNQLAIVVLPVPLNSDCNCHVQRTRPHHADDCRYAQLALAVWHLDPTKFEAYHHWLMAGDQVPPLAAAVARAERLFGRERLETAIGAAGVHERIEQYVQLYAATGKWLPLILIKDKTIRGDLGQASELFRFLERYLGLEPVPSA
jgi:uncharacterized membrane protein